MSTRVDVHFKTPAEHRLQSAKHPRALDSLVEVAGNSAHGVVGVPQSIQRDVDVQFEFRIAFQAMLGDFVDPPRLQPVCRKVDMADAVLRHEKIDDIFQVAAKRRFTAAEPQVRKLRHAFGELDDFLPVQITRAIQFIPVETGVARGIAVGSDEEDQRVQLAASPRYTSVRFGEISLYCICRHVMLRVSADRIRLYSNNSAVSGANRI